MSPGEKLLPLNEGLLTAFIAHLGRLETEALLVIYVGRAGTFLGDEVVLGGTTRAHGIPYRHLFERAFSRSAQGLVIAHNHPSGCTKPSQLDLVSTRGLQALALPMGIELIDHLIVGVDKVFSMRAAGLLG